MQVKIYVLVTKTHIKKDILCNDDKSVPVLNRALFAVFHERTMLVNEKYHLPWYIYTHTWSLIKQHDHVKLQCGIRNVKEQEVTKSSKHEKLNINTAYSQSPKG